VWILTSFVLILIIMAFDYRFYRAFAYPIYISVILLLVFVLFFGSKISGSTSWFKIGGFGIQPSEFAKFATALAMARFMSDHQKIFSSIRTLLQLAGIIVLPIALIMFQGDTGTALVFTAFVVVLYREGLSPVFIGIGLAAVLLFILTLFVPQMYLITGIVVTALILIGVSRKYTRNIVLIVIGALFVVGIVRSVDFIVTDVLKPHQQNRIKALINPDADPLGYGWNVTQSKIAIGSGGLWGKGFLEGTQTKYDFVPEQSTDFIFCTIGEEHGWIGSLILIALFVLLLIRITMIAERQKSIFARVYGYALASILLFHFAVNIGMTIGLFPVIGIPLPFFSYGGSSLWAFTVLLFIFLKLDVHRMQILTR
jgi:rod shape determining protein RodA